MFEREPKSFDPTDFRHGRCLDYHHHFRSPVSRVSYGNQVPPPRTTPQSLIPGSHLLPSPPTQLELQTVPPSFLQQANLPPQATEDVQSPVTAHPKHTTDNRKMPTSPSPTSHNTFAMGSSYYDPFRPPPPFSSRIFGSSDCMCVLRVQTRIEEF